ncbi:H-NS histone family protein [Comamonas odontotermitis]|uniref:H-NS histone family protein n=1 Tax=Comamonas odontotermitis TaxID=379895 RepID=UPI001CC80450|nr:H-NS histone family protein [Comamonas odontotermitis]UBB15772.1 H-NS histone family protein [Comamonas odontotermitis]
MATLKEIDAQLDALLAQREEIRKNELKSVIGKIRSLVVEYGLSSADVFPPTRHRLATTRTKVAAKYRDPVSGSTWTGRGKAPKWIEGQDREKFAIKE